MDAMTAAVRLGYSAILLTNRKSFLRWQKENVKIIYMESMAKDIIQNKIIHLQQLGYDIRTIISFVDPYVSMAANLSNQFCGSAISSEALERMEDKAKTRLALQQNKATCDFEMVSTEKSKPATIQFPFIMKKTRSNGSNDVFFIETEKDYEMMFRKLTKRNPDSQLLVEEYIEGTQYVIEVVVVEAIPIIVAVIRQEILLDYTFIVTAYDVVIEIDEKVYESLWNTVISIIHDIGLHNGTCHFEMRHSSRGWKLIELNPRISGGAMNRMIEEAYGIDLVSETLKLYLGEEPDLIRKKRRSVHSTYITLNSTGYLLEVDGVEHAVASPGVVDVYVKSSIGATMMPPLSMGHRYGYVMAVGESADEARDRAEHAVRFIQFYIEPF